MHQTGEIKNRNLSAGRVSWFFWGVINKTGGTVLFILFATVLGQLLRVVIPLLYKDFFDILSQGVSVETYHALVRILWFVLLLNSAGWLIRRVSQFLYLKWVAKNMTDLFQTAFDKLIFHSQTFFADNFTGSLVKKITRLPKSFEVIFDRLVFDFIPLFVTVFGATIVLYQKSVFLGGVFFLWVAFFMAIQVFIIKRKYALRVAATEQDSYTGATLADAVTNSTTIKTFAGENYERGILRGVLSTLEKLRLRLWMYHEKVNSLQGILTVLIEVGLFYLGIKLWQNGQFTVGDFVLIQVYVINTVDRIWHFGNILRNVYDALAEASEAVEIIDTPIEVDDKRGAKEIKVLNGAVLFKEVNFSFVGKEVFKDFNFEIKSREKIAIVGTSGAGKSTLVKLLFRFHDVISGSIEIDGQNISEVTQKSLRENISLVPQEPVLFHRTLMENIRYGRRDASDEDVIEAAKKAHAHEFISKFPEGYNAFVGERGVKLSGGERQRIAIARAILKNAPILVLDEATSSLDSESEALIQNALTNLMKDKTVIVIAHRLSTIMRMDRIIVLENGKIVEEGKHTDLVNKKGVYNKFWSIQAGGFMDGDNNFNGF